MLRANISSLLIVLITCISSLSEAREIFWTGKGFSEYGLQYCKESAFYNGLDNARYSCENDFGYSYYTCQNAGVTQAEFLGSTEDYYGTSCRVRVYIQVR